MVDVRAVEPLPRAVSLQEIKAEPKLAEMALVRVGRLSVVPVTAGRVEDGAGHEQARTAVSPDGCGPPARPAAAAAGARADVRRDPPARHGWHGCGLAGARRRSSTGRWHSRCCSTRRASAERRERFLREARTSARLEHPHIIDVFRADETDGTVWFTMRFVDGESLGDRMRERETLPVHELLTTLREVAWGLAYAHARGVVHRDIKPDNILLDRDIGRAVLTDFGIARDVSVSDNNLTIDGHVLGSVQYMSPEQAAGDTVDGRTDIYAVGCVAFQALSGPAALRGAAAEHARGARHAPGAAAHRGRARTCRAAVAELIDRCLRKNPADRFPAPTRWPPRLERSIREVRQLDEENARCGTRGAGRLGGRRAAIWQRAAQLQAEAAHRLERHCAPQGAPSSARSGIRRRAGGYRMRDVEQAAEGGGHLAAVRRPRARGTQRGRAGPCAGARRGRALDRQFTTLLGTTDRAISVSRVIPASAKETLAAIGTSSPPNRTASP